MSRRESPELPLLSVRRRPRPYDPEAGQGLTEYVGVVGIVILVVILIVGLATPVGADIGRQLVCAVQSIGSAEGFQDCVAEGDGPGGENGPGDGDGPGSDDDSDDGPCEGTITTDVVEIDIDTDNDGETERKTPAVIQIDCVWYPVPWSCVDAGGDTLFGDEEAVYDREELEELANCVTKGWGEPSDDPDDESCNKTKPSSEDISLDPPRVRIGCTWRPVPEEVCDGAWEAYKNAEPGRERAAAAGPLNQCVRTAYDNMEPDCYIEINTHSETETTSFLFFRFSSTEAVLIEKLGDGRVRVHILEGSGFGAGVSAENLFGSPISFGVAGINGVTDDTTYEFVNMEDAQRWIDWKEEYDKVYRSTGNCSGARVQWTGGCDNSDRRDKLEELEGQEPDHHVVHDANQHTKTVTFNGGLDGAVGGLGGSVEGGYEGEVIVEDRLWDNGLYEVSYTSTDIGGFLIGGMLGGGKSFGKGGKSGGGSVEGSAKVGGEWKGSTKTTVYWGEDGDDPDDRGDLVQIYITIDDQALRTLYQAGIDIEAELPYGFTIGGGYSKNEQEGKSSVQEFIIDFNQYPELRAKFEPIVDKLFPRDANGRLKKDDIEIQPSDQDPGGEFRDALEKYGNVRELTYDDSKTTESGEFGIGWQGIDLFKNEWITSDEVRTLNSSTFEITDVNGDRVVIDPAPRCSHERFEPDDDYYTNGKDKTGAGGDWDNPRYNEDDDGGPYPGTGFDGDVPGDREEKAKSLAFEYANAFPDKHVIVVHEDIGLEFGPDVKGKQHLATVGDFRVVAIDSGTVTRQGDGGFINWAFYASPDYYDRPGSDNVVHFKPKSEDEKPDERFLDE
ncbi:hypothetical protein [Myceligenerans pegani]|uniref:Uncharacterized protein n=1 Tax=Myceligenerans pegani TaxID=2776917 RepID=A0ABR9N4J5_9MICO|nr:hypothetical protein [Myceligenerans sp. TRM 65318]MBE1878585.1 hypothetical protein [Myceligenerans sp. TRM 65318]MBE3020856.1 hypothetical protein [Myceligenerans sp. TRM 65318]